MLLSLLANIAAWLVGVFLAYVAHDADPEYMEATHERGRARRLFNRRRARVVRDIEGIRARFGKQITEKSNAARTRSRGVEEQRNLMLQVREHERAIVAGLQSALHATVGQDPGCPGPYRGAAEGPIGVRADGRRRDPLPARLQGHADPDRRGHGAKPRMKRAVLAVLLLLAALPAHAALFGAEGLDPAFCKTAAARQTVLYVDDMMMTEGKTDWATKLSTKLRATLAPGERVTVVRLSPAAGRSAEIWSGCWPAYTAAERARIAGQSYLFSRSPLDALEDQQNFFLRDLSGALGAIYTEAKRPADAVWIDAANPPGKEIIRALASDEGRFAHSQITIRAILYSDMAENSDLGSVFRPLTSPPENYGRKLGTYLRRSVFYAYGLGEDVRDDPGELGDARAFWTQALRSMNASVGGLGADLNMANAVPVTASAYNVILSHDGQELDGRLALMADADSVRLWIAGSAFLAFRLRDFPAPSIARRTGDAG